MVRKYKLRNKMEKEGEFSIYLLKVNTIKWYTNPKRIKKPNLLGKKAGKTSFVELESFCGIQMSTHKRDFKDRERQVRASRWETLSDVRHSLKISTSKAS